MKLSARKHLGTTGRGSDRSPERGPGLLRGTGPPAEVTAEEFPPSAGITLRGGGGLRRNGLPRSSSRTRALQHESGAKADGEPEHIIAGLWRAGNERNRGAFGTVPGLVAAVQGEGSFLADTTVVGWLCRGGDLRRAPWNRDGEARVCFSHRNTLKSWRTQSKPLQVQKAGRVFPISALISRSHHFSSG